MPINGLMKGTAVIGECLGDSMDIKKELCLVISVDKDREDACGDSCAFRYFYYDDKDISQYRCRLFADVLSWDMNWVLRADACIKMQR